MPMNRDGFDSDVVVPKCIARVHERIIVVAVMNHAPTRVLVPAGAYVVEVESFGPAIQSILELDMPVDGRGKPCLKAMKIKPKEWIDAGSPPPEIAGITVDDSHLAEKQKSMFEFAFSRVQDAFAEDDLELGETKDVSHHTDTGSTPCIRQQTYRVCFQFHAKKETMLIERLQQGIIEPSSLPRSSPVVLVEKKDGKLRFGVDFKKINDNTSKDSCPLPSTRAPVNCFLHYEAFILTKHPRISWNRIPAFPPITTILTTKFLVSACMLTIPLMSTILIISYILQPALALCRLRPFPFPHTTVNRTGRAARSCAQSMPLK